jgi:hypothetical protein
MSRSRILISVAIAASVLASILSCSSGKKKPGPLAPSGLVLTVEHSSVWISRTTTIEAGFAYPGKAQDLPVCTWHVDGVPGGDETLGTISQENPAVYTAPMTPPPGGQVEIRAVWEDDESIDGTAVLGVQIPAVSLSMPRTWIQVEETLEILASLEEARPPKGKVREDAGEFDWYVNDELGGNEELGTITQGNPALYTAPFEVPVGLAVQIKAVWTGLPGYDASGNVTILNTIRYVNAGTGEDEAGRGRLNSPYRTISFALSQVEHGRGDTILVAPGVYDLALGEQSGNSIRWDTTLRGVDRDGCIIDADPSEEHRSHPIFWMSTEGVIENFTIRNSDEESVKQYAIEIQGDATVRNLLFNDPFTGSPIRVMNPNVEALIEDCEIVNTRDPGEGWGLRLSGESRTTLRNTTLRGWDEGIRVEGPGANLIERCSIRNNRRGIMILLGGVNTDLGGGAAGSEGNNVIQGNAIGLYNGSDSGIHAKNNTWGSSPPTECPTEADEPCDFYNHGAGSVIWE